MGYEVNAIALAAWERKLEVDHLVREWKASGASPRILAHQLHRHVQPGRYCRMDDTASNGFMYEVSAHRRFIWCEDKGPLYICAYRVRKDVRRARILIPIEGEYGFFLPVPTGTHRSMPRYRYLGPV